MSLQSLSVSALFLSATEVCAWAPPSSPTGYRKSSDTSLRVDPAGMMDFVKGLDSALGNPTAASAIVDVPSSALASVAGGGGMDMKISNSVVLLGGGLASLSLGGIAFLLTGQQDEKEDYGTRTDIQPAVTLDAPRRLESESDNGVQVLTVSMEASTVDSESQSTTAAAERLLDEKEEEEAKKREDIRILDEKEKEEAKKREEARILDEKEEEEAKEIEEVEQQKSLLAKLKDKLKFKTEELETNQGLLEQEQILRVEMESKVVAAEEAKTELTAKYQKEQKKLAEIAEKLNFVEIQLQAETKQREEVESALANEAESNRQLEDQYELEQNAKYAKIKELDATKDSLDTAQRRLTNTRGELSRVNAELESTSDTLETTSTTLSDLQEEQRSLRTLGKKMWRLSKNRVQDRIQKVGKRLRKEDP